MNSHNIRTHDVSLIDCHVKDIETFGRTLDKAAIAAFPHDGFLRYKEAHVLLLSWEDDDLGVIEGILELECVFRQLYHYEVEYWKIPSKSSFNTLREKLNSFLNKHDRELSLLIVHYGGYGSIDKEGRCMWSCTGADGSTSLPWYGLQATLEQADSDILILLDSCAAGSCTGGSGHGITEVIAACGSDTWTPSVGGQSFTRSLINVLADWQGRCLPLSAAVLHSEVLSRIKCWNPKYNNLTPDQRRQPAEQSKLPIYTRVANEVDQRSIVLTAMKLPMELSSTTPVTPVQVSAPDIPSEVPTDAIEPTFVRRVREEFPKDVRGPPRDHCPTVLLSLALEADQRLATKSWAVWLQSTPALLHHAHVEAIHESESILVLLSLPVAVWNLLPSNPAVNFVAFIRSWDLMKDHEMSKTYTLRQDKSRLVDFLNDDEEPGLEFLRQESSIGTSLMPDKSDWLSQGSLPCFSSDTVSEDVGSVNTDIGERQLRASSRLLELGAGDISVTPGWPPLTELVLECPFRFLDCELRFATEGDWASHSLMHFRKQSQGLIITIEPPMALQCNFCDAAFENENANVNWRGWMEHVATHHRRGERLAHARPNFALIEYCWQQGLIQATQYRELKGPSDRTLPSA